MRPVPRLLLTRAVAPGFVCQSCRLQRRLFSNSTPNRIPAPSSPPKPPPAGFAALPSRRLISVAGPDAAKFLQGLISSNILSGDGQPRTDAFYTAFLNATGRVVNDFFIYPHDRSAVEGVSGGPAFLIEGDAKRIDHTFKIIKRYKLRAKVNLRKIAPEEASVWQAWDDSTTDKQLNAGPSSLLLKDPRLPAMGHRILQFNQQPPALDLDQTTEDSYTIRRYLMGIAEGQDEILMDQGLPLESNMEFMNGIDFHKGCYVGQELTIRTKHRGVVRKRILPCVIYSKHDAPPTTLSYDPQGSHGLTADMVPGETSIGRDGKRGRSAGKWLKGVGNIGLGLCRLELMTDVQLLGEQTWNPADEFVMSWGDGDDEAGVKIKAFVPDWVRSGIASSPPAKQ